LPERGSCGRKTADLLNPQVPQRKQERSLDQGRSRSQSSALRKSRSLSACFQERATDQVDGRLAMVVGCGPEAGQVGGAFALASRIEGAQTDDQIAQRGQVLGSVSSANRRSIFAEGDVAHMMDGFDLPVAAPEGLQLGRIHLGRGAAAEDDFGFLGDRDGFEMVSGADNDGGLDGVREAGLGGSDLKGIDLAGFMSAVSLVQSDVRRGKKRLAALEKGGPVCQRAWVGWL